MKRFNSILATTTIALLLGACGTPTVTPPPKNDGGSNNPDFFGLDLFGVDLTGINPGGDGGGGNDMTVGAKHNTGEPCAKAADCAGNTPQCLLKDAQMNVWPDGYCTSKCNPSQNDPNDGTNTACPGGQGTCAATTGPTVGTCLFNCMDSTAACRTGYGCFAGSGCEPLSFSDCDPTVKPNTCPQDAGLPIDTDAGTVGGQLCVSTGDQVGACTSICDVFAKNCPNPDFCYANPSENGAGICFGSAGSGQDGDACMYLNSCDSGLGCEFTTHKCRFYCGGPSNVACPNMAATCKDLSTMPLVPKTIVGICSM